MSPLALDWLPGSACRWLAIAEDRPPPAVHRDEQALVAGSAPRRQRHFAAGRACAHAALAALGRDLPVLSRAGNGAPRWPDGIVGSLSHCPEAAVAIVAPVAGWAALGIDVEADRPLPEDAAAYVLADDERARLAALPGGLDRWALAAFAAKECVHKCVHPRDGSFLEFAEVAIVIEPGEAGEARFRAEPRSVRAQAALAGLHWRGELRRRDGLLFSLLAGR